MCKEWEVIDLTTFRDATKQQPETICYLQKDVTALPWDGMHCINSTTAELSRLVFFSVIALLAFLN